MIEFLDHLLRWQSILGWATQARQAFHTWSGGVEWAANALLLILFAFITVANGRRIGAEIHWQFLQWRGIVARKVSLSLLGRRFWLPLPARAAVFSAGVFQTDVIIRQGGMNEIGRHVSNPNLAGAHVWIFRDVYSQTVMFRDLKYGSAKAADVQVWVQFNLREEAHANQFGAMDHNSDGRVTRTDFAEWIRSKFAPIIKQMAIDQLDEATIGTACADELRSQYPQFKWDLSAKLAFRGEGTVNRLRHSLWFEEQRSNLEDNLAALKHEMALRNSAREAALPKDRFHRNLYLSAVGACLIASVGAVTWKAVHAHDDAPIPEFVAPLRAIAHRDGAPVLVQIYPMLNDSPDFQVTKEISQLITDTVNGVDGSRFRFEDLSLGTGAPLAGSPRSGSLKIDGKCDRWDPSDRSAYSVRLQLYEYSGQSWEPRAEAGKTSGMTHPVYPSVTGNDCSYLYLQNLRDLQPAEGLTASNPACNAFADLSCYRKTSELNARGQIPDNAIVIKRVAVETEQNFFTTYITYLPSSAPRSDCADKLTSLYSGLRSH